MDRKIFRAVNIDGEQYGPGQEDEMVEHLEAEDDRVEGHDHEKELKRMEKAGFIAGFVDLTDEERLEEDQNGNADQRANKRAQVQEIKKQKAAKAKKPAAQ